jgi:hypothetical protein
MRVVFADARGAVVRCGGCQVTLELGHVVTSCGICNSIYHGAAECTLVDELVNAR